MYSVNELFVINITFKII